jgi:small-conductance mechanosensitive channel
MLEPLIDARDRILVAALVLLVAYLLGQLVAYGVRRRYTRLQRPSFAAVMSRVSVLMLAVLGLLAALTVVFPTVQPVDTLGSLGIFSIAIGFAFRDILENLLAGILLLFRAPFRTGDEIEVEGVRGTVQEINLRETVLRTYEGRRVLVPNATVYKNEITVQTAYDAVRTEAVVGVAYDTDLRRARQIARDIMLGTDGVADDPPPLALVGELGVSTVDLQLLWWSGPQQREVRTVRDRVLGGVVEAYNDAGIEMPAEIVVLDSTPETRDALARRRAASYDGLPAGTTGGDAQA